MECSGYRTGMGLCIVCQLYGCMCDNALMIIITCLEEQKLIVDCDMFQSDLCAYDWFKFPKRCRYQITHNVQCDLEIDHLVDWR